MKIEADVIFFEAKTILNVDNSERARKREKNKEKSDRQNYNLHGFPSKLAGNHAPSNFHFGSCEILIPLKPPATKTNSECIPDYYYVPFPLYLSALHPTQNFLVYLIVM